MNEAIFGAGVASYPAGVLLRTSVYSTNLRAAFSLVCADDGMPYGALSVNVPDADLAEDEILASADWNLPAELKAALLGTGKFVQTGRSNQVGLGRGEIWRIADPELLSQVAAARVVTRRTRPVRRAEALA
ncbi:hypothetical protein PO002_34265 [Cupriavidus necator]|uniref:hypothetical protein n=1 Tax=Cupriavidus necator TaxID=106590 RepID=UPI0039C3A985